VPDPGRLPRRPDRQRGVDPAAGPHLGGKLNTRAALLEVINDALGLVAVLVAAVVIAWTGWTRADAVASLLIGMLILPHTWKLLRAGTG
jgi:Co/Zn/Cd efflux system component